MANLLLPGRHHTLTNFQATYLYRLINGSLAQEPDVHGNPIGLEERIDSVIFPVTSANHRHTRRNPLPMHLRAMMIQEFCAPWDIPAYVFAIDDVGMLPDSTFAQYTINQVNFQGDDIVHVNPENTLVACSTPHVITMYEQLGYRILPVELASLDPERYHATRPWEIIDHLVNTDNDWRRDPTFLEKAHPATVKVWKTYAMGDLVRRVFRDHILGDDGDITDTRDYQTYVRAMDDIAQIKWNETQPFVRPGNIGDIGCAVGSWIKLASEDERLVDSSFYGIEVARELLERCQERKEHKEFGTHSVFFRARNGFLGTCFDDQSMDTVHTGSLTHEVLSYVPEKAIIALMQDHPGIERHEAAQRVGEQQLAAFLSYRHAELRSGGVWINRDVIGPEEPDRIVRLWVNENDGTKLHTQEGSPIPDRETITGMSTASRFYRFVHDFRRHEGYRLQFETVHHDGETIIELRLQDAMEFLLHKDYTDNWSSEMHERYCALGFSQWRTLIEQAGFEMDMRSHAYANPWIVEHRFKNHAGVLTKENGFLMYPAHTMIMAARKH